MVFEFDKYDARQRKATAAEPNRAFQPIPQSEIRKISFLYWAEHCVECAAPSCYQTCSLYEPRTDLRCRRFTFGSYKNRKFHSLRGYGVEISFKKWAKLEAYGNVALLPTSTALLIERFAELMANPSNAIGSLLALLTGKQRWRALSHVALEAVARKLAAAVKGDSPVRFLLKIYNPSDGTVRMQLSFSPVPPETKLDAGLVHISHGMTRTLACPPGYSRHDFDFNHLNGIVASGIPFVVRLTPEADSEASLVFLTADFVQLARRSTPVANKAIKCVVFDLDNTLWKGILIEKDDVALDAEVVRLIKYLDERGVLLSVASKNDLDLAFNTLKRLGLDEYFLAPQISWGPKSTSIQKIADSLNIGLDSLAFIDDNPFELDEVASAFPEVTCIPVTAIKSLFLDPRFQGSTTADARTRRELYRQAEQRNSVQASFGSDYQGFLASCQIELEISSYDPDDSERVHELVQRTNQLNFSGKNYERQELEALLAQPHFDKLVLRCLDRYGSYGTVGFCIAELRHRAVFIRDFMLSCRVQGKLLEAAFFNHLFATHYSFAAEELLVRFRKTRRNGPAQQALESLGFRAAPTDPSGSDTLSLQAAELSNYSFVRVVCACSQRAAEAPAR